MGFRIDVVFVVADAAAVDDEDDKLNLYLIWRKYNMTILFQFSQNLNDWFVLLFHILAFCVLDFQDSQNPIFISRKLI